MAERPDSSESPGADSAPRIFDRITDAVFALDEDLRFTYLNEQAERLLQADADTLIGDRIWDAYPEARGSKIDDAFREVLETQQSTEGVLYYEPLDIWVSARVYPSETGLLVYSERLTRTGSVGPVADLVAEVVPGLVEAVRGLGLAGDGALIHVVVLQ